MDTVLLIVQIVGFIVMIFSVAMLSQHERMRGFIDAKIMLLEALQKHVERREQQGDEVIINRHERELLESMHDLLDELEAEMRRQSPAAYRLIDWYTAWKERRQK